ncbi:GNAT family N-acetyltransferase [Lentilactobacillus kosonis]|uniref:GNAT family acetyltransferase YjcF n=1 Tax=Lentilactobacillus kosonis TaxID=2810561 RepID=A0A401FID1_9LACO|nr:GNAT family N-acetyltransferase [Lentilactobacillus kosonis]GAY72125.1 GNAT family acetyltransferase YjcF [Lentilactobacillus kosonis]
MEVRTTTDLTSQIYTDARMIRRTVFIEEQGVVPAHEFDGSDDNAVHFVAYVDDKPAATARGTLEDDRVHIQRVATLKPYRGQGVAKAVIQALIADPQFTRATEFYLGAQETAIGFYEKLGFKVISEPFMEAGIRHRMMALKI